ncbi:hypothetical protein AOLI_G00177980 [Acnodon oligacanthus]
MKWTGGGLRKAISSCCHGSAFLLCIWVRELLPELLPTCFRPAFRSNISAPARSKKKPKNQYSQPLSDCPVFSAPLITICLCITTVLLGILLALLWITLEASMERLPARCKCAHTYVHPLAPIAPLNQVRRRHL